MYGKIRNYKSFRGLIIGRLGKEWLLYKKKIEGYILLRLPKNINNGGLIDNRRRSLIVTYNNNKKEGM